MNEVRIESVKKLLESIPGEDARREGLLETPGRVAGIYDEIFGGYKMDPKTILGKVFGDEKYGELIIARNIDFYSHCEHHMVLFFGRVHIGYIPNGKIVGLSKLPRLVDCYARRLQIQERMTTQIANAIDEVLRPLGVMVVIEAEHMCIRVRGIKNYCTDTVTSAVRGVFRNVPEARHEFLTLIRKG
ncbi:MAG: GTP cyclohydrolase 1 [Syntrophomonadaceae bacterium]|nr:GTP cyclohydrolase 1 [Bacillota bacterium]